MLENGNVQNTNMEEERLAICEKCGIYNKTQNKCSSALYIDPKTNNVSSKLKDGYVRGCGCYIPVKIKKEFNHCPANKW